MPTYTKVLPAVANGKGLSVPVLVVLAVSN
jgi:hypothetical protein